MKIMIFYLIGCINIWVCKANLNWLSLASGSKGMDRTGKVIGLMLMQRSKRYCGLPTFQLTPSTTQKFNQ